jgi:REP element-mobilizing transposase RayT
MARGNGGQRIFVDDADRIAFLDLIRDGVDRFGHSLYAFCLMDNHIHLALRTGEAHLSRIMQNLMFRYTRHSNRRLRRVGHLFQGRFRSVVVEDGRYLMELVRYIHLNPVRAHLVKDPADWAWSAHRAYLGKEQLAFLDSDWVLRQFAPEPKPARRAYERFVLQGMGEGHGPAFRSGEVDARIIGDEGFVLKVLGASGRTCPKPSLDSVVSAVCEAYGMDEATLAAPGKGRREAEARGIVALLAQDTGAAGVTEVGRRFGRDVTASSMALLRVRAKARGDGELSGRVEGLKKILLKGSESLSSDA